MTKLFKRMKYKTNKLKFKSRILQWTQSYLCLIIQIIFKNKKNKKIKKSKLIYNSNKYLL